jgi:hypothetical protein
MPFPQQIPRVFSKANVEAINPGQMGCYGLFRQGEWIYVGKGDIRARLLVHLNDSHITRKGPTHWVDVVTPFYDSLEKKLIVELNPALNKKVG